MTPLFDFQTQVTGFGSIVSLQSIQSTGVGVFLILPAKNAYIQIFLPIKEKGHLWLSYK